MHHRQHDRNPFDHVAVPENRRKHFCRALLLPQRLLKHCRRLYVQALLVVISLGIVSGCAGIFYEDGVEKKPPHDVAMAMQVKAALLEQAPLDAAAIHVEATEGVVHLSGFVEEAAQRQLASQIAQQVAGVKKVVNVIEVK